MNLLNLSIIVFSAVSSWVPRVATRGTSAYSSTIYHHLDLFIITSLPFSTFDHLTLAGGDLHRLDLLVDPDHKVDMCEEQDTQNLDLELFLSWLLESR